MKRASGHHNKTLEPIERQIADSTQCENTGCFDNASKVIFWDAEYLEGDEEFSNEAYFCDKHYGEMLEMTIEVREGRTCEDLQARFETLDDD